MNESACQKAEQISAVKQKICSRLAGRPVNAHTLADAAAEYYEGQTMPQLEKQCEDLFFQLEQGRGEMNRLFLLSDWELEKELSRRVLDVIGPFSDDGRQYLLLMLQLAYQSCGYKIDGGLSVYLANLPVQQLQSEVVFFMQQKGAAMVGEAVDYLAEVRRMNGRCLSVGERLSGTKTVQTELCPSNSKAAGTPQELSELEIGRVEAAAVYAALHENKGGYGGLDVPLAKQIGLEMAWSGYFRRAVKDAQLPVILRLFVIAGVILTEFCFISPVTGTEIVAVMTSFQQQNHRQKLAMDILLDDAAKICGCVEELFAMEPFLAEAQARAVNAQGILQDHVQSLRKKVHDRTCSEEGLEEKTWTEADEADIGEVSADLRVSEADEAESDRWVIDDFN